jgi:hypothetical protein
MRHVSCHAGNAESIGASLTGPGVYLFITPTETRVANPAAGVYKEEVTTMRVIKGGWVDRKSIPRGPNGRGCCRWCSLEVPRGRFTFCSEYCVHEWKLRTQPAYVREQVLKRDRGICACCGMDTIAATRQLRYSRAARRTALLAYWGLKKRTRKSLWDADHILPVAEGGGECDLDNMRTLCLCCHRQATIALRERIRMGKSTKYRRISGSPATETAGQHQPS